MKKNNIVSENKNVFRYFSGGSLVAIHATLIAIPIIVLVLTVAFNSVLEKGFLKTLISKPEWYFIALVFCVEALLDCLRINQKSGANDFDARIGWALVRTIISAVLAGLAMRLALTVGDTPHLELPQAEASFVFLIALMNQVGPLHFWAVPVFLACSFFYAKTKFSLIAMEKEEHEDGAILKYTRRPRVFSVDRPGKVKNFYDLIADVYTDRNRETKGVRNAQDEIIGSIRARLRSDPTAVVNVLDIGGGTGYGLYNILRGEDRLNWLSLDISPKMTQKFFETFPSAKSITGDCINFDKDYFGQSKEIDIAVLSFSLSSMPKNIDFDFLKTILKNNGEVLIADVHPGYIAKSPCFDVNVDHRIYALALRKVEPLILEHEAFVLKFKRIAWKIFENERGEVYSFFLSFKL